MRQDLFRNGEGYGPIGRSLRRRGADGVLYCLRLGVLRSLGLRTNPLRRLTDDFACTREVELFLNIGPMSFDGFFAQMELASNLMHIAPFADQLENLQFPIR